MTKKIAVFGDLIIDKYDFYRAVRLSPEGPAPVVTFLHDQVSPGGAGNVVMSLANQGLHIDFYTKVSKSSDPKIVKLLINLKNVRIMSLIVPYDHYPPTKVRQYVDNRQFMRIDSESIVNDDFFSCNYLVEDIVKSYDSIVISDYAKGSMSPLDIKNLLSTSKKLGIKSFVDTKQLDYKIINNAYCLKINNLEFTKLYGHLSTGESFPGSQYDLDINSSMIQEARLISNIDNLVVTFGDKGSILAGEQGLIVQNPEKIDVVDITGAGDAFISAIIEKQVKNDKQYIDCEDLAYASKAAATVIQKMGTIPVPVDFERQLTEHQHKTIVGFTNGCFDIIHSGHIKLFEESKKYCDYLVVGLNSDDSIKRLKGETRPFNALEMRLKVLKSIKYIDEVLVFDDDTPISLIKRVKPDILIKGSDYSKTNIVGADFVESYGGEVKTIDLLEGQSSSRLIQLENNEIN